MIIAAEIVSGLFCGYLAISICESFFHRTIQHANPALRLLYEKWGWAGESFTYAWYAHHVVHHFLTFKKNHVTQFSNEEERARLDSHLNARRFGYLAECRYGLIVGSRFKYYAQYAAPTLPIFIFLCYIGGNWFTIWSMLAALFMADTRAVHSPLPAHALSRCAQLRAIRNQTFSKNSLLQVSGSASLAAPLIHQLQLQSAPWWRLRLGRLEKREQ
jgi:hypothetical protein